MHTVWLYIPHQVPLLKLQLAQQGFGSLHVDNVQRTIDNMPHTVDCRLELFMLCPVPWHILPTLVCQSNKLPKLAAHSLSFQDTYKHVLLFSRTMDIILVANMDTGSYSIQSPTACRHRPPPRRCMCMISPPAHFCKGMGRIPLEAQVPRTPKTSVL
jgi:hypothetical protein